MNTFLKATFTASTLVVAVAGPAAAGSVAGTQVTHPTQKPPVVAVAAVTPTPKPKPVAPPAPAPAPHYLYGGQTSYTQVAPYGEQGDQVHTWLDAEQKHYAYVIVEVAADRGMPAYAAVIAVATALQESKLVNYTDAVDHDSLGLFQQRPSTGWGTPGEIENPVYAANAFLSSLQNKGFNEPLSEAAQDVQGSAFPDAYAKWQDQAADIVSDISNGKF